MDGQEPLEQAGGGKFMASWLKIIGAGREDLADPVVCLAAMAAEGLISKPRRWIRGQDPNAGGSDALASVLLCQLETGAGAEWVWCDPTEDHPALAMVEGVVMANARRFNDGGTVEPGQPLTELAAYDDLATASLHVRIAEIDAFIQSHRTAFDAKSPADATRGLQQRALTTLHQGSLDSRVQMEARGKGRCRAAATLSWD